LSHPNASPLTTPQTPTSPVQNKGRGAFDGCPHRHVRHSMALPGTRCAYRGLPVGRGPCERCEGISDICHMPFGRVMHRVVHRAAACDKCHLDKRVIPNWPSACGYVVDNLDPPTISCPQPVDKPGSWWEWGTRTIGYRPNRPSNDGCQPLIGPYLIRYSPTRIVGLSA